MNKKINFEDSIFILEARIRMIRDLLHLDTDTGLFYTQTMNDLEFINNVMEILTAKFLENMQILDREVEADNIVETEWKYSQLLIEVSNNSSPFSASVFPQMTATISKFKKDSAKRQKLIDDAYVPTDNVATENVVTNAEITGLLGPV
ncbi:MAG: hypothetical protein FWB86_01465 [Treponema sp.]|nr:hypothetical protein [Treponema sp.]MCL2250348.1 hypothetical protein [Treponema sp.]